MPQEVDQHVLADWARSDVLHWVTGRGHHSFDCDWLPYLTAEDLGIPLGSKLVVRGGTLESLAKGVSKVTS